MRGCAHLTSCSSLYSLLAQSGYPGCPPAPMLPALGVLGGGGAPIPLSCLPPGLCCVLHLGSLELRGPGSTAWAKLGHPRASVSPRGRGKNSSRDGTASVVVGGRCSDGDGDRIRLFPNPHPVLPAEHPWLCMEHPNDCPNAVRRRSGAVGCKADPCP